MDNPSEVKKLFEYLPESIKFHKLKNEGLARLVFVLVLFCQLIGNYVQHKFINAVSSEDFDMLYSSLSGLTSQAQTTAKMPSEHILYVLLIGLGITLLVKLVSNLLYSLYMYSYIRELRGKDSGFKASFKGVFKHIGRLIGFNIIFGILLMLGFMFFILPGVIAYVMFVFSFCYILDLKLTVSDAMTASSEITKGKKTQLVGLFVGFYLLFKLPMVLILSGSSLASACVASFFSTIASMILQRLITQIYMDLEYKKDIAAK